MGAGLWCFALLLGFIVCGFVAVTALGIGIYFLNQRVLIPSLFGGRQGEPIIEEWAAEYDCEVLEIERVRRGRKHPFADRFGVGLGKWPGAVYSIEVRTPKGKRKTGWVYLRMGLFGQLLPNSLEVIWDEDIGRGRD
jgi:hypothetical protein